MRIQGDKGHNAEVDAQNRLVVLADTRPEFARASADGDAYAWNTVTADIAAAETALMVTNDSESRKLYIHEIWVWSDVPTEIDIHLPAYPTLAGTAVTGVNLNRTAGKTAPASAYADETGNTQANLFLTTHTNELATDQHPLRIPLYGAVVLGYHDSIAVDIVADSAAFNCTILGYFKDE